MSVDALSEDVAHILAQDVEYRIRQITLEASKFSKHAHRQRLSTRDVGHAMELLNVEVRVSYPIYVCMLEKNAVYINFFMHFFIASSFTFRHFDLLFFFFFLGGGVFVCLALVVGCSIHRIDSRYLDFRMD